ncbi:neurogenic locus notch homolog protein 2-like isoform X4 [Biomphalaria glabrata]|uniref:Neurogenic locus notch homolog protein 2-like isoform X4 n=1 Tax=Biomphalaria glabrata TaxID=6526 RepID=A0A9W2YB89_BIOGL|nr:neurogenic locus notch homolog protein 2-like isoform X4 [Biomphalaria glabrata]
MYWIYSVLWFSSVPLVSLSFTECGEELSAPYGDIVSPDYPSSYPDNALCNWLITVQENDTINLRFRHLDLERYPNQNCKDYIMVYDGASTASPIIGLAYCGYSDPEETQNIRIKSTSNHLYLVFRSDNDTSTAGFSAFYWVKECANWTYGEKCSNPCQCNRDNTLSCDRVTGQCLCYSNWTSSNCSEDVNECSLDQPPCDPAKDHSACQNSYGTFECVCVQGHEQVNVTFCKECGEILREPSGKIVSHRHHGWIDPNQDECYWTIIAPVGFVVSIRLTSLDLFVADDHIITPGAVKLFDDNSSDGELLAKFYGKPNGCVPAGILRSSGNELHIARSPAYDEYGQGFSSEGFELIYWTHECQPFTYGDTCTRQCECVQNNTARCDSVTGQCICFNGWTSSDCSLDIDECCEDSQICPDYSECLNTHGSYDCVCYVGLELSECGQCEVPLNATCTNRTCSHICAKLLSNSTEPLELCYCPIGMQLYGDECLGCPPFHYGADVCNMTCSCDQDKSESCDSQTGECVCRPGWTSASCSVDVDECQDPSICSDLYSTCVNTAGSYICQCFDGMVKNLLGQCEVSTQCQRLNCSDICIGSADNSTHEICSCPKGKKLDSLDTTKCFECADWFYGENCQHQCYCNETNTQSCDKVTGQCLCYSNWTSCSCSEDVDECSSETSPCNTPEDPSVCSNVEGSFQCLCLQGFEQFNQTYCDDCGKIIMEPSGQIISTRHGGLLNPYLDECSWTIVAPEGQVVTVRFDRLELHYSDEIKPGSVKLYDGTSSEEELLAKFYGKPGNCIPVDIIRSTGNAMFIARTPASSHSGQGFHTDGFQLTYWTHECDPMTYGESCTNPCTCVQNNTARCDSVTGQCTCLDGWTSSDCSQDIDECSENPLLCPDYSQCQNTNGSYDCVCYYGLQMSECGQCEVVPTMACTNRQCSHICVKDNSIHSTSLLCYCPIGMKLDGDQCFACGNNTYGPECSRYCECVENQTLSCDTRTGDCNCLPFWKGSYCSLDYDVCTTEGSSDECQEHAVCTFTHQTEYRCRCCQKEGYIESENGTCVLKTTICGDKLTGHSGTFNSPNFPFPYPDDSTCFWSIAVKDNLVIDLRFDDLDLESYWNQNCKDYIVIYDGPSAEFPILGPVYCGFRSQFEVLDLHIRSTSNKLYIMFRSDETFAGSGFNATYWAHDCPPFHYGENECNTSCACDQDHSISCDSQTGECLCHTGWASVSCAADVDECQDNSVCPDLYSTCINTPGSYICQCFDGMIKNTSGQCQSSAPCHLLNCSDACIVATNNSTTEMCQCPKGKKIDIFDPTKCIECSEWYYGENCQHQCYCDVMNTQSCDKVTGQCLCYSNWTSCTCSEDVDECSLEISPCSTSDHSVCRNLDGSFECVCLQGFENVNGMFCEECGQTLTELSGKIISGSHYGFFHTQFDECSWTISVPQGHIIFLNFTRFQLYHTSYSNVRPGFILIYDGDDCNADLLATLYGDSEDVVPTQVIRSTGNNMYIIRIPASRHHKFGYETKGFEAFYWSDDCTVTADGSKCNQDCACIVNNTDYCDVKTGNCVCKIGWTSSDCSVDIDECLNTDTVLCPEFSVCINTIGGFYCKCKEGFKMNASNHCEVCNESTWGPDCVRTCGCVVSHTLHCDPVNGSCQCQSGWTGRYCEQDKDECSNSTISNCEQMCLNTLGGYVCTCYDGYIVTEIDATKCDKVTHSFIIFTFDIDVSRKNFEEKYSDDYNKTKLSFEKQLLKVLKLKMRSVVAVYITNLEKGSLIVSADVVVNEAINSSNTSLNSALQQIGSEIFTIDNQTVLISHVLSNGVMIQFNVCENRLKYNPCSEDEECIVIGDTSFCKHKVISDDRLLLGLAIGLPLFVGFCTATVIIICCYVRKRNNTKTSEDSFHFSYSSYSESLSADFEMDSTRLNTGSYKKHRLE